jgi:hypothetical protein
MTTTATAAVPPDDELLTQIIARRRRRTPLVTLTLVVAAVIAAAIIAGVEIQKHYGAAPAASSSNSNLAAFASRFSAGRTGGAAGNSRTGTGGAGLFGGSGAVIGTVTLIKGNDIYVTDTSGTTTIVNAKSATVTKSVAGSLKSINPGDAVTVVGTPGSNGSTTARSITVGGGNG